MAPTLAFPEAWLSRHPEPGRLDRPARRAHAQRGEGWLAEVGEQRQRQESPEEPRPSCWRAVGKGLQQAG